LDVGVGSGPGSQVLVDQFPNVLCMARVVVEATAVLVKRNVRQRQAGGGHANGRRETL
jgi:hypothetical protein